MKDKLKPCPFCGADAHLWTRDDGFFREDIYYKYQAAVECNNTNCEALIDSEWCDTEEEAIQAVVPCWNRRVNEDERK